MRILKKASLIVALAVTAPAFANTVVAEKPVNVGTGGATGNYFGMTNDVKSYCDAELVGRHLNPEITGGSVENIIGMNSKKYSMIVLQEDVLQYFSKTEPRKVNRNNVKIVTGLHMEPAHLLIPKGYQPQSTKKGWKSMFSSYFGDGDPKPISLDLLKGQNLGSWGGSIVSAKALSYFLGLNLQVTEVPEAKRNDPNVPLLLVGGHPYKPVEELLATGKYHLVPIDFSQLETQAPFYLESSVSYMINGKVTSVPTFGVRALLVGKSFRKESRNETSVALAKCIDQNLADLADDPDTNPNWGSVYELEEEGGQTNWSYFAL